MSILEHGTQFECGAGSFQIRSLASFVEEFSGVKGVGVSSRMYFRGDGDRLVPKIGKPWHYGSRQPVILTREKEWQLLHRFRRFTNPKVNSDTALWETLFLARHHELPTRLLDWSTNPLVALYFALDLRSSTYAPNSPPPTKYVWAITLRSEAERADIDVLARRSDPLKPERIALVRADGTRERMRPGHDAVKIVFPVYNSARITAQRGIFTWQSDPQRSVESYVGTTLPDQNLDLAKLYRWSVPVDWDIRISLMKDLQHLGIDARTIFPDLDGMCHGLLDAEILFS